jgi:hypothetical protein
MLAKLSCLPFRGLFPIAVISLLAVPACTRKAAAPSGAAAVPLESSEWRSLFDGKSLGKWRSTPFGGEGTPRVEDGKLILPMAPGGDLTGVTRTADDIPKMDYEITLEAQRVDGSDFFCGLTFPVSDSHASLILGGWGGSVCGISCLDFYDAANNETTKVREFENGRWYSIRMRITQNKLEAWLDDEKLVDVVTTGRKIGVRFEVEPSRPFGLATYRTTAALRNIRVRSLSDAELGKL